MTNRSLKAAAIIRILTGIIFIAEGWGKIAGNFLRGGFAESTRETAAEAWPFWSAFLRGVVLPNASAFGWFFAAAELALGIGLLVGLLTRAAAVGGMLLMAIILLGQTNVGPAGWERWVTAGLSAKFALLLLGMIFLVDAGSVWGIDARLRKRGRAR